MTTHYSHHILLRDESGVLQRDENGVQLYSWDITIDSSEMVGSLTGRVRLALTRRVSIDLERGVRLYVDRYGDLQTRRRAYVQPGEVDELMDVRDMYGELVHDEAGAVVRVRRVPE